MSYSRHCRPLSSFWHQDARYQIAQCLLFEDDGQLRKWHVNRPPKDSDWIFGSMPWLQLLTPQCTSCGTGTHEGKQTIVMIERKRITDASQALLQVLLSMLEHVHGIHSGAPSREKICGTAAPCRSILSESTWSQGVSYLPSNPGINYGQRRRQAEWSINGNPVEAHAAGVRWKY